MNVSIVKVDGSGVLGEERIILKVTAKLDIGRFILCDSTYLPTGKISNRLRHTFWFPDKLVNPGDFIRLFTKKGTDSEFANKAETVTHVFYWGLAETLWNKAGDGAVLIEIGEWAGKKIIPHA